MRKCIIDRKRLFPGSITHMKWHVFLSFESAMLRGGGGGGRMWAEKIHFSLSLTHS